MPAHVSLCVCVRSCECMSQARTVQTAFKRLSAGCCEHVLPPKTKLHLWSSETLADFWAKRSKMARALFCQAEEESHDDLPFWTTLFHPANTLYAQSSGWGLQHPGELGEQMPLSTLCRQGLVWRVCDLNPWHLKSWTNICFPYIQLLEITARKNPHLKGSCRHRAELLCRNLLWTFSLSESLRCCTLSHLTCQCLSQTFCLSPYSPPGLCVKAGQPTKAEAQHQRATSS